MAPFPASLPPLPAASRRAALRWLALAVAVLLLSGLLSLCIVFARLPGLGLLAGDPDFFRRCLVVHVDLALVCWFYSFLAALMALLPVRRGGARAANAGLVVSAFGVALLVACAAARSASPVLANYVPVLDTPAYVVALAAFGIGVGLALVGGGLLPGRERWDAATPIPPAARPGLRAAAVAFLMALATFAAAAIVTPRGLVSESYYELVFWGGGHTLQFASEAAMMACWIALLEVGTGRPVIGRRPATALFALLVLPTLAAPLLALAGTSTRAYHTGFTRMMQWGLFPVVLALLALGARSLLIARRDRALPDTPLARMARRTFAVSATLTAAGFVLGALIRGPNTMVPAHYHANIGAVTAAFMGTTQLVFAGLAVEIPGALRRRIGGVQPVVFGVGQLVFAIGFGLAGRTGSARKVYGAEQHVRTALESFGLWVMGLGGAVAVAGGVLFLLIAIQALRAARRAPSAAGTRRLPWSDRISFNG